MNVTSYVSRYWTRKINVTKDLNSRRMFRQLMSILLMTVFCSHSRFENYQFFIFVLPRCHTVLESTYTHKKKKCIYIHMYTDIYIYMSWLFLRHISRITTMQCDIRRRDSTCQDITIHNTRQNKTGQDMILHSGRNLTAPPSRRLLSFRNDYISSFEVRFNWAHSDRKPPPKLKPKSEN